MSIGAAAPPDGGREIAADIRYAAAGPMSEETETMPGNVRVRLLHSGTAFLIVGIAAMAWTSAGTYAATALQPLPSKVIVGLDIRDRSPRNLRLPDGFLTGVHDAGIAVG